MLSLLVPASALADDGGVDGAFLVGGGSTGDTTDSTVSPVGDGATWHLRGVLGTRSVVAGELAYVGSLTQTTTSEPLVGEPNVMSHAVDVAMRFQLPIELGRGDGALLEPFVSAGVGGQLNDVVRSDLNAIELTDEQFGDDVTLHVPVGGGLAIEAGGIMAEARVTYRPAVSDVGFATEDDRFYASTNALSLTASIGAAF